MNRTRLRFKSAVSAIVRDNLEVVKKNREMNECDLGIVQSRVPRHRT